VENFKQSFWKKIIAPKSLDENKARQEYILNILLTTIIILVFLRMTIAIYQIIFTSTLNYESNFLPLFFIFGALAFFVFLYFLSRCGHFRLASYILLLALFSMATFMGCKWGIDLPAEILFYILVIVISGILIGAESAFFFTFLISGIFLTLGHLQEMNIASANRSWINEPWGYSDIIISSVILFIIAIVSWLFNRELKKSLSKLKQSEAELKSEKDLLEIRVEEKTGELIKAQAKEIAQVYRFAEFGKLSSGLFHDLVNPLTTVMLNVEKIKQDGINHPEFTFMQSDLEQIINASQKMKEFINSVRKQISPQGNKKSVSLNREIEDIIAVLNYKSRKNQVEIIFSADEKIIFNGDPIKFGQIISNLLSNAIDSYNDWNTDQKEIAINLIKTDKIIALTVIDKGKGMDAEVIKKIFEPFYTTKTEGDNLGLGLSLIKKIIEADFSGSIKVLSAAGAGTTFTVSFPLI